MVVGPLYPFVDCGGDLTCNRGDVGHPLVLMGVCCHGVVSQQAVVESCQWWWGFVLVDSSCEHS